MLVNLKSGVEVGGGQVAVVQQNAVFEAERFAAIQRFRTVGGFIFRLEVALAEGVRREETVVADVSPRRERPTFGAVEDGDADRRQREIGRFVAASEFAGQFVAFEETRGGAGIIDPSGTFSPSFAVFAPGVVENATAPFRIRLFRRQRGRGRQANAERAFFGVAEENAVFEGGNSDRKIDVTNVFAADLRARKNAETERSEVFANVAVKFGVEPTVFRNENRRFAVAIKGNDFRLTDFRVGQRPKIAAFDRAVIEPKGTVVRVVFRAAAFADLSVLVNRFHRGVGLSVDVDFVDHRPTAGREGAARRSQRPNDRRSLRVRNVSGEEFAVDVNAEGTVVDFFGGNDRFGGERRRKRDGRGESEEGERADGERSATRRKERFKKGTHRENSNFERIKTNGKTRAETPSRRRDNDSQKRLLIYNVVDASQRRRESI